MINTLEWEIGNNLDNLENHQNKTVTNLARDFVDVLKSKYKFNSEISNNYNLTDLYSTSKMIVIPIIFHKPNSGKLDYINDEKNKNIEFNLSYLTLELKCLGVYSSVTYGQRVGYSDFEYYSVCNRNGKFDPSPLVSNNDFSLDIYDYIGEGCGLSSNKLIECTFYRNEQDENPFKISITDRYFLTSINATYANNMDPKFSINTNHFSYYPNNKFIIFKDDCIFLPKDFREFLVNGSTQLKLENDDDNDTDGAEKIITKSLTSSTTNPPFGVTYEINSKN